MIDKEFFEKYLKEKFGNVRLKALNRLGAGVHGTGFLVELYTPEGEKKYVLKDLSPEGLGHIYPSDRAGVFLLAFNEYGKLPNHVKAIDVLSLKKDGSIKSISGGIEYFLLMETAEGTNYFTDLEEMKDRDNLNDTDTTKIHTMVSYLSRIHAVKKDSKLHYFRKLRDTIGHGECLMGVFDTYPDGTLSYEEMAEIERKCIDWRAKLKPLYRRLSQIHGDFHPGNIWFKTPDEFILLDRSRGAWGDPADDVTALTINYIFFSIKHHDAVTGAYLEALKLFFNLYIKITGDEEILNMLGPFFAFRGVVVANPRFYPELTYKQHAKVFSFINGILDSERFEPEKVNEYI